jgi:hypothetical protein
VPGPRKLSEGVAPTDGERPLIVEEARKVLRWGGGGDQGIAHFIADGKVPSSIHEGGGTYGGIGSAQEHKHNRTLVAIYFPTPKERESHWRWHDYCAEHGYPAGELVGADAVPGNSYPPRPCSIGKGRWACLSWAAIRAELAGRGPAKQMSIFTDAELERGREIARRWDA